MVVQTQYIPYLIAVNLTKRCNLACSHCYMDAEQRIAINDRELKPFELKDFFNELSRRAPGTIVVLTGGEPLMYPDLLDLISHCSKLGLRPVVGTNGLLLHEKKVIELKAAGLHGVGVSLDGSTPKVHDDFRGMPGSFNKVCENIKSCVKQGLHVQIHYTIHEKNKHEWEKSIGLAKSLGASILNFFFLVCVGRGSSVQDLSPEEYEKSLNKIADYQKSEKTIMIQARCAPHFKRILYEKNPMSEYTRATGYDGGGCPAATHYARIAPDGEVTPCPYMEISAGNLREKSFWDIWDNAPLFKSMRNTDLILGKCGKCEFKELCGGCRARSLAQLNNLMEADPSCIYEPKGGKLIASQIEEVPGDKTLELWTEEAEQRLARIPLFLRKRVKKALEEKARAQHCQITADFMREHKKQRETEMGIKFK